MDGGECAEENGVRHTEEGVIDQVSVAAIASPVTHGRAEVCRGRSKHNIPTAIHLLTNILVVVASCHELHAHVTIGDAGSYLSLAWSYPAFKSFHRSGLEPLPVSHTDVEKNHGDRHEITEKGFRQDDSSSEHAAASRLTC